MNRKKYLLLSFLLSVIAVVLIGYKWHLARRCLSAGQDPVTNRADLEEILRERDTIEFQENEGPLLVPTGFFIQSLAFKNASDVNITGYIWQKYPVDYHRKILEDFIFPEEVESSATKKELVYEYTEGVKKVYGWYFDVTMRQSFDYSDYPLDSHSVWLRVWPKDFINDDSIFLIPDFEAYELVAGPDGLQSLPKKFGLDVDIVPGGWEIDDTFFSYKKTPYDTDFGFFTDVKKQFYKEFYFNLGIRRKFRNAFVINLVPLFIVALLLFAQLMTVTGDEDRAKTFGFTTTGVIATCAALFFVVMLAHVQVRQQFVGSELVYIEYFYLIMYIVILITALNGYLFSLGKLKRFNIIYFQDNFIPKVAYWPVVLWMMAIATWMKL